MYICDFLDQLLHPYKFYGRDMSGILSFTFASCELLKVTEGQIWMVGQVRKKLYLASGLPIENKLSQINGGQQPFFLVTY